MSRLLLLLYNIVYLIGFLFYLPLFLWRMLWDSSYRHGLRQRLGYVEPSRGDRDVLWVHGVSVGEVKAAAPIVEAIGRALPHLDVVISATTPTGRRVAQSRYPDSRVVYYPLDFWQCPGRALDRVRPCCVLLMELELWPNFLQAAERRGIPVAVVNGRISERSFRGYRRVSWLLPQLDRIDLFSVQNPVYADRLARLGVTAQKIQTVGNLKYDCLKIHEEPVPADPELEALVGRLPEEAVLVAGSTHGDEEARLARVAGRLEKRLGRTVRLVVAPRHPERCSGVVDDLKRERGDNGVVRLTEQRANASAPSPGSCLVVDTIGELEKVYSLADVVFVGGSLAKHGGQNMLEPVALGKATVLGPHIWNFQADVDLLLEGRGILQVQDDQELEEQLAFLLSHRSEAMQLVRRGQRVLRDNQGATERTLHLVLELLRHRAARVLEPSAVSEPGRPAQEWG